VIVLILLKFNENNKDSYGKIVEKNVILEMERLKGR